MKTYARLDANVVVEIIPPFATTEEMRPPAPQPLPEDASEEDRQRFAEQQEAHDSFYVGEVPISERFHPDFVATLVEIPAGVEVQEGYVYDNGQFSAPPPYVPPPMSAAEVKALRNALLTTANLRKGALQDAVDIGEATPEEEALLVKYKQYTTKLTRIEQQPGFPASIDWPVAPE